MTVRYNPAMKTSAEFDRFKALLSRVVTTPRSVIEERAKREEAAKARRVKDGRPARRHPTLGKQGAGLSPAPD